jgi:cell division protein FtsZ
MAIEFLRPEVDELKPRISVIGVGGAGGNAIANMIASEVQGVDFIVANTDAQALNASPAESRIQLGMKITQGLGAGSRPEIGRAAAEETMEQVEKALDGAHMCFIAAGMGGGTGTGAAPVIAKAAREKGILTVGVVTKPFSFEGSRRMKSADAGIQELQKHVDTLIVIPNQNLFLIANPNTTFKEAFLMADEVLQQGVRGITDLMVMPGLINLDFADVRSVMSEMGKAMMGTGEASGENRAIEAAETANHIKDLVDPDANIIWGSAFNNDLDGKIRVSVVATGIEADASRMPEPAKPFSFPSRSRTEVRVPGSETPSAAAPASESPTLDLAEPATPEPTITDSDDEDELVLGEETQVSATPEEHEAIAAFDEDAAEAAPARASGPRRWLQDNDGEAAPAAAPAPAPSRGGSTLFERMSSMARGSSKVGSTDDDEEEEGSRDPLDIPRFLNRQSNQ